MTEERKPSSLNRARFLLPNAITSTSMMLGATAIMLAMSGRHVTAGWLILISVLLDKLDGTAARLLKASSQFGVEYDSLADLLAFGMAPATLTYAVLSRHPGVDGVVPKAFIGIACGLFVLCSAVRLARFNVDASGGRSKAYTGAPMPLAGGFVTSGLLLLLKYSPPELGYTGWAADIRLLGSWTAPVALFRWYPLYVVATALLMISPLKVPKLGLTHNKVMDVYLILNISIIYAGVPLRVVPEYLWFCCIQYFGIAAFYHLFYKSAKAIKSRSLLDTISLPPQGTG